MRTPRSPRRPARNRIPKSSGRVRGESISMSHVEENRVQLCLWAAFLLKLPARKLPSLHVVGINQRTGRSRVSSTITLVDATRPCIVTETGRIYDLLGEPCQADLAAAVLVRLTADWDATVLADATGWLFGTTDPANAH